MGNRIAELKIKLLEQRDSDQRLGLRSRQQRVAERGAGGYGGGYGAAYGGLGGYEYDDESWDYWYGNVSGEWDQQDEFGYYRQYGSYDEFDYG